MIESCENTDKICEFIHNKFCQNELTNDSLVQIIEHCGMLLNLKTISDYAKENNMSYNGTKRFRKVVALFNCRFVVDNE